MKEVIIAIIILVAIGSWFAIRARAQTAARREPQSGGKPDLADAGKELRRMMLTMSPKDAGITPTKESPRVYAILMDWPIDDLTATVFSASSGAASLYTTSTFGIIGGEGHKSVRTAAKRLVRAADRYYDAAAPTTEYPYPRPDRVRFYLLTFQGVRFIETDFASVANGTGKYAELFRLGQEVLTELRIVTEKKR